MKKHLLKSLLALALVLITGNAWGEVVTLSYSGSTTNMTGNNDAAKVGLDATSWSVVGDKGGNGNLPGLNKAGQIRLYGATTNHNFITVSALDGQTITSIAVTYGSSNYEAKVSVDGEDVAASGDTNDEKTYAINSSSFTITHNYSSTTQVYILSIDINYSPKAPSSDVLQSLVVSGTPTKTEYEVGDAFDPTGLTVTGTYSESGEKVVSKGVTWTVNPQIFTSASTDASVSVTATVGTVSSVTFNVTGLTVIEPVVEKYSLVADASNLKAGDKLLIVGIGTSNAYYALKQYESGNNNCKMTAIQSPADGTITIGVGVADAITLGGEAGAWTLFDGAYYLYAAGGTSSNNYLKGATSAANDNAKWTISITDGKATIKTKDSTVARHTIRFNTSSSCFSCYASGQADVYIYKLVRKSHDVTIASSGKSTLYLDYAATVPEGVKAYYATGYDSTNDIVTMTEVTDNTIAKNQGVMLMGEAGETYTFEETVDVDAPTTNYFGGSVTGMNMNDKTGEDGYYILQGGQFAPISDGDLPAYKAYLYLEDRPYTGQSSTIGFRFGDATQIENVNAVEADKYFDLMGREVLNPTNGIYILNGKKVLVK